MLCFSVILRYRVELNGWQNSVFCLRTHFCHHVLLRGRVPQFGKHWPSWLLSGQLSNVIVVKTHFTRYYRLFLTVCVCVCVYNAIWGHDWIQMSSSKNLTLDALWPLRSSTCVVTSVFCICYLNNSTVTEKMQPWKP